jgi:putative membrane protein
MKIIARIMINAVALAVVVYLMPTISISNGIIGLLLVATIFGVVNAFIRPIVRLFTLPITCLTLGLFTLVINALMLILTDLLSGFLLDISGNLLERLVSAFIAAIIISIVSGVLNWFIKDDKK